MLEIQNLRTIPGWEIFFESPSTSTKPTALLISILGSIGGGLIPLGWFSEGNLQAKTIGLICVAKGS